MNYLDTANQDKLQNSSKIAKAVQIQYKKTTKKKECQYISYILDTNFYKEYSKINTWSLLSTNTQVSSCFIFFSL